MCAITTEVPRDTLGWMSRIARAVREVWPPGAPGRVLLGLLAAGLLLRVIAMVSWWPTTPILDDGYQIYAESDPFDDPQHPAGYGLVLAAIGSVTREVAVPVLLQHMSGFASAFLLWAATRRISRSVWAGLLPAAVVLLNPDQIFLEHAIMSESWALLATSAGLYAACRAFDEPAPWWRWPVLTGLGLGIGATIRTAGLLVIPVTLVAVLLARPGLLSRWRDVWLAPVAAGLAAGAIVVAFAGANAAYGERFGVGPSPGWYLYGRVAQFADCSRFSPPSGTEVLCDERRAGDRPGASFYLFNAEAPAPRFFGQFGDRDELIGEWSRRALRAQPGDFASLAWQYLRAYWVPSLRPKRPDSGGDLDPQLDFTNDNPFLTATVEGSLETFYNDFKVVPRRSGLDLLRAWQRVARFGAVALSITTVLTLLGLVVGSRRSRAGVLLFGVGGLALIVAPALTGNYVGRYTVPMAGPLAAAASITLTELWRRFRSRAGPAAAVPSHHTRQDH
jgi:4-amino-4-deoxy-L-arabinose transferase-like glycosyltransferase